MRAGGVGVRIAWSRAVAHGFPMNDSTRSAPRRSQAQLRSIASIDQQTYSFETKYELVSYFVSQVLAPRRDMLARQDRDALNLVLRELLLNAIEHGNLGFGFEDKTAALEAGTWKQLVSERQRQADCSLREVRVWVDWALDRVKITIRDEGTGFDWRSLPDPTQPEYLLCEHGRGVLMARLSVDSLTYNETGNEVTVVRLLSSIADCGQLAG